ncbi:MAG: DNA-binding protein, partial [bacterium]|nr:DNA-binding protein [bacterium]
ESSLGNKELLKLHKTAFLCSRNIPASAVLKCFDWAIEQREKGNCIVSGFHSRIEKDVFHYLLAGTQPIILVLARGMKEKFEPELRKAIDSNRLLVISPFEKGIKRISIEKAQVRNRFMINLANEIVIGYVSKDGMLNKLTNEIKDKNIYNIIN